MLSFGCGSEFFPAASAAGQPRGVLDRLFRAGHDARAGRILRGRAAPEQAACDAVRLLPVPSRFMRKIVCRLRLNEVNRQ